MLKCIHMYIIEVYLGEAGQILEKTISLCLIFEQLFKLTVLIHLIMCFLWALTFVSTFWKFYSWEKNKEKNGD